MKDCSWLFFTALQDYLGEIQNQVFATFNMLEDPHVQKTYNIWVSLIPGIWAIGSCSLPQTPPSHPRFSKITYLFFTAFCMFAPHELWALPYCLSSGIFSRCFHISLCHNFLPWEFPSQSLYTVARNSPLLTSEKPRLIPSFLLPLPIIRKEDDTETLWSMLNGVPKGERA